jgi:hypothetical protein
LSFTPSEKTGTVSPRQNAYLSPNWPNCNGVSAIRANPFFQDTGPHRFLQSRAEDVFDLFEINRLITLKMGHQVVPNCTADLFPLLFGAFLSQGSV